MSDWLLTADLHFDDKPEHEYRFEIANKLIELSNKYKIDKLAILGDLTEKKDNHSSTLVNNIMFVLSKISVKFLDVVILKGNHDYLLEDVPFFKFLESYKGIHYVNSKPEFISGGYFIPHSKEFTFSGEVPEGTQFIGIHQTVDGAIANNNFKLSSPLTTKCFSNVEVPVFSGDIHKAQKLSYNFEYVGSPYNIYFGDDFQGGVLKTDFENETCTHIPINFPRKFKIKGTFDSIRDFCEENLEKNDLVKLELTVPSYEKDKIQEYKTELKVIVEEVYDAKLFGIEVFVLKEQMIPLKFDESLTSSFNLLDKEKILMEYSKVVNVNKELLEIGKRIINET